jgi:hypothetical protein
MAIIGFMVGALIVIILRGLQSLDPIWASGPGLIMGVIFTAAFFVWGMGAFDPRLSIHGDPEAEEAVHEELEQKAERPSGILTSSIWQLVTATLILSVILGGFAALPGGLTLTQTVVPGASPTTVGFADVPLPFGGPTVQVSTLVIFAVFVIWAFISLAAFAWVLMWLFTFISRGLAESRLEASSGGTLALTSGEAAPEAKAPRNELRELAATVRFLVVLVVLYVVVFIILSAVASNLQVPVVSWFMDTAGQLTFFSFLGALAISILVLRPPLSALTFLFTFIILYYFFYYVAIGLIMPAPDLPGLSLFFDPPTQLVIISALNALIFTLLILHTQLVLQTIGRVARWLAKVLRSVPRFLQ